MVVSVVFALVVVAVAVALVVWEVFAVGFEFAVVVSVVFDFVGAVVTGFVAVALAVFASLVVEGAALPFSVLAVVVFVVAVAVVFAATVAVFGFVGAYVVVLVLFGSGSSFSAAFQVGGVALRVACVEARALVCATSLLTAAVVELVVAVEIVGVGAGSIVPGVLERARRKVAELGAAVGIVAFPG